MRGSVATQGSSAMSVAWPVLYLVVFVCPGVLLEDYDITTHMASVVQIQSLKGSTAYMPCDLRPPSQADAVQLVLWYRYGSRKPLYSYDVRVKEYERPKLWADDIRLRGRGYFDPQNLTHPFRVVSIEEKDEGLYRCRVDFKLSPTKNSLINVTLIVPPEIPRILDHRGREVQTVIGPYNEGDDLYMVCETTGGRPSPHLKWLKGRGDVIDSTFEQLPDGSVRNDLRIPGLQRTDVNTAFTCQASNSDITVPTYHVVRLDMNFKPLDATIMNKLPHLSADRKYEIICQSIGARPPPRITWWKDAMRLRDSREMTSGNGNVTTSTLVLTPRIDDHGKVLKCQAENKHIPHSVKEDSWELVVHYKPVASVKFGKSLRAEGVENGIEEGKDVYFECNIRSNPPTTKVEWRLNAKPLHHNVSGGIIISNHSLVLQRVSRTSAGEYSCVGFNAEGQGESQPINLKVKYPPVCQKDPKESNIFGAAIHEETLVTCRVDAEPEAKSFRWAFNNSATKLEISREHFSKDGHSSTVRYQPFSELDYGSLLCWATNEIGVQEVPCVYHIIYVGKPEPPHDCNVDNHNESVQVRCQEGNRGTLTQQQFILEVYEEQGQHLLANVTNTKPSFVINGLTPGTSVVLAVYATNPRGRSDEVRIRASTQVPQERVARQVFSLAVSLGSLMSNLALNSLLPILVGVTVGLTLVVIAIIVMLRLRTRASNRRKKQWKNARKTSVSSNTPNNRDEPFELDEKNPDLIPQGSGLAIRSAHLPGISGSSNGSDDFICEQAQVGHGISGVIKQQGVPKERRHVSFCDPRAASNEYLAAAALATSAGPAHQNNMFWNRRNDPRLPQTQLPGTTTLPRNYGASATPLLQGYDPAMVAYATLDRTPRIPPPKGFGNGDFSGISMMPAPPNDGHHHHQQQQGGDSTVESTV